MSEDYLSLIVSTHVIAASKNLISENNFDKLTDVATAIVTVTLGYQWLLMISAPNMRDDGILLNATDVLSLGLLWHGFHDAVKEADGDRILNY